MATGRVPTTANSPLTAKGDLFTYDTSQARLAVGNNGETLVADSSASTGLRWTATPAASNPVINSSFDIWQRGTTFSNGATNTYTADRWSYGRDSNATGLTVSRQSVSDSTNLPNIQYAARAQRANGNTSTAAMFLVYNLETADSIPFAGKTITFSYYARAGANFSPTSSQLNVVLQAGTGTDQNAWIGFTGNVNVLDTNQVITTTWTRYSHTVTLNTTATQIAFYFREVPVGTAGANDWFEVTGVQINIGNTALPYRRYSATLAGELAACQRYYEVTDYIITASTTASGYYAAGYWKVNKRATPTITIAVRSTGSGGSVTASTYNPTSTFWMGTYATAVANAGITGEIEL